MTEAYNDPPKTNADMLNKAKATGMIFDPQVNEFGIYLRDHGPHTGAMDIDVEMFDVLFSEVQK